MNATMRSRLSVRAPGEPRGRVTGLTRAVYLRCVVGPVEEGGRLGRLGIKLRDVARVGYPGRITVGQLDRASLEEYLVVTARLGQPARGPRPLARAVPHGTARPAAISVPLGAPLDGELVGTSSCSTPSLTDWSSASGGTCNCVRLNESGGREAALVCSPAGASACSQRRRLLGQCWSRRG